MADELRLGTRGSQLALWQANEVAARIAEHGGPACRIVVIKTTGDSGGYNMLMGPFATRAEIDAYVARMQQEPGNYIGQPLIDLSTHPTYVEGRFEPRRIDLRPFILSSSNVYVTTGGLTRVAMKSGSLVVNSSQGGGSKDTWVLADGPVRDGNGN